MSATSSRKLFSAGYRVARTSRVAPSSAPPAAGLASPAIPESFLTVGDRIRLPQSAMEELSALNQLGKSNAPLTLLVAAGPASLPSLAFAPKASGPSAKHPPIACGVLDFSADPGTVQLPQWMASSLGVNDGDLVTVSVADLPRAESCSLQGYDLAFYRLKDQRAALEIALMSQFTTLTKGEKVRLDYEGNTHTLLVVDLQPEDRCCIVDTDVDVSILPPPVNDPIFTDKAMLEVVPGSSVTVQPVGDVYTYVKLHLDSPGSTYRISCTVTPAQPANASKAADIEAFLSPSGNQFPLPTRLHHLAAPDADRTGEAVFTVAPSSESQPGSAFAFPPGVYIVGVRPYNRTAAACQVSVTLSEEKSAPDSVATMQDIQPAATPSSAPTVCPNCRQSVPQERMSLHLAYCERNNAYCAHCNKAVPKKDLASHSHCEQCGALTTSEQERAKHLDIRHSSYPCDICKSSTQTFPGLAALVQHQQAECPARMITCRFCHNFVKAGNPSSEYGDRLKGFTEHESYCGSRTELCKECRRPVKIRDWQLHARIHEFDSVKKAASAGAATANASSAATGKQGSPGYSPAELERQRRLADAVRERIFSGNFHGEAPLLDQEAGMPSSGDPGLHTSELDETAHLLNSFSRPKPVRPKLCANFHCVNALAPTASPASSLGLCAACLQTVKQVDPSLDPAVGASVSSAFIKTYFKQLMQGCGNASCANVQYCRSASGSLVKQNMAPTEAAAAAIQLVSSSLAAAEGRKHYFCVDASMESKHEQAQLVSSIAGVSLNWAVFGLEKYSGDVDRTVLYLMDARDELSALDAQTAR